MGGISLSSSEADSHGLLLDRQWALSDLRGNNLTQRRHRKLALFSTALDKTGVIVTYRPSNASILIPFKQQVAAQFEIKLYPGNTQGHHVSKEHDEFFSTCLGIKVRLLRKLKIDHFQAGGTKSTIEDQIRFTDGYPYLIIGQSSLDELNEKLDDPILMDRFRPNIVFTGGVPNEEDQWNGFTINGQKFHIAGPCPRCKITTIDQQIAVLGKEPLRTLATYRQIENEVMFGANVLSPSGQILNVGDELVTF